MPIIPMQKISNGVNKFLQSKIFKIIIIAVGAIIVFLFVFKLGVFVGERKASFSYRWGENYHRNFGGPREGFFGDFSGKDFIDAYGVVGQIIKIDVFPASAGSSSAETGALVIKGRDSVEKIVAVKKDTVIKRNQENVKIGDLKNGDFIVVIGNPNDKGQIEAKFIRLMPPPGASSQGDFKGPRGPGGQSWRMPDMPRIGNWFSKFPMHMWRR